MFERINRKLTNVARLHILISEAEGQLQQARTEKERESLRAKIRDFARMKRKHDQTVRKRRETLRANKVAAFSRGRRTSLELIGDLVQAGLNAGLVDAWRAGEADAADKIIASLDR